MDNRMRYPRQIFLVLLVALVLRLAYGLAQEREVLYQRESGGDSWWYLDYGNLLVTSSEPGPPPSGPVYLVWVGIPQHLFSPDGAILFIRVFQAIISTATVYFVYRLGWTVSNDERVGLLAAGVLAVSPVFVMEAAQVLTETLYVFLLTGGLWFYVRAIQSPDASARNLYRLMGLIGLILGLATLTRAVLLAFPLGLAIHLVLVYGWRGGLKRAAALLLVYVLVVSTWTIYNRIKWNQWVIGAQGFAAFLYIGSTQTGWQGPTQVDSALAQQNGSLPSDPSQQQQVYTSSAIGNITANLGGWLKLRATKEAEAYLQPHGTTFFGGESLKDLAANWLEHDRTFSGLVRVVQGDAFWPKLIVYVFHYVGLLAGLVGIWLTRRNWRVTLPLVGFLLYTSLVHFVIEAMPRYLFPMEPIWWIFAAVAIVAVAQHIPFFQGAQKPESPVENRMGVAPDSTQS